MNHIFLTGEKGVGKTTLLHSILGQLQGNIGGFQTKWMGDNLHLLGYGEQLESCTMSNRVAFRYLTGAISVPEHFNEISKELFSRGEDFDVFVMDELGYLERDALEFQKRVLAQLRKNIPVLGVIKPIDTEFLNAVRQMEHVSIVTITQDNREELTGKLLKKYESHII